MNKAVIVTAVLVNAVAQAQQPKPVPERALVDRYCIGCHSAALKSGGLVLEKLDVTHAGDAPETWEKVIRKVRAGMMPPSGVPRPDRAALDSFAANLEIQLDRAAASKPVPASPALHRLNRTEYANAVRDLLALEVDAATLLPADDSSEGFDNIAAALAITPALVERYTSAAVKVAKLAVGNTLVSASTATYRAAPDYSQAMQVDGMPLGTRGGLQVRYNFPVDGDYTF